jgi:centromeric protein E
LPPSPLSGGIVSPTPTSAIPRSGGGDSDLSPVTPGGSKILRKKKLSLGPATQLSYGGSSTPSLLNGSGSAQAISSGPGARGSDGLLSLPSPPQSRSSSAQDSYSTSATTYDDVETGRGRQTSGEIDSGSPKLLEGKGNVIVSVRVRPDAGGGDAPGSKGTDGEWLVDGRRSLVAYRSREGGDYYYGKTIIHSILGYESNAMKIMFLRHMTTMLAFMMHPPSDWYEGLWKDIMEQYLHMV